MKSNNYMIFFKMRNEEKNTIAGLFCDIHSSGYRKKKDLS